MSDTIRKHVQLKYFLKDLENDKRQKEEFVKENMINLKTCMSKIEKKLKKLNSLNLDERKTNFTKKWSVYLKLNEEIEKLVKDGTNIKRTIRNYMKKK